MYYFQAKQVFENICPGEEFLPKAPNPEDIIFDDGETGGENKTGFEQNSDTVMTTDCTTETSVDESSHVVVCADDSAVTDHSLSVTDDENSPS